MELDGASSLSSISCVHSICRTPVPRFTLLCSYDFGFALDCLLPSDRTLLSSHLRLILKVPQLQVHLFLAVMKSKLVQKLTYRLAQLTTSAGTITEPPDSRAFISNLGRLSRTGKWRKNLVVCMGPICQLTTSMLSFIMNLGPNATYLNDRLLQSMIRDVRLCQSNRIYCNGA